MVVLPDKPCGCGIMSYPTEIVFCPLHANAETTAKQRDQLLEAAKLLIAVEDRKAGVIGHPSHALRAAITAAQPAAEATEEHLHEWKQVRHREYIEGDWKVHYCQLCTITPCYQYRCIVELDWQPQKQEV